MVDARATRLLIALLAGWESWETTRETTYARVLAGILSGRRVGRNRTEAERLGIVRAALGDEWRKLPELLDDAYAQHRDDIARLRGDAEAIAAVFDTPLTRAPSSTPTAASGAPALDPAEAARVREVQDWCAANLPLDDGRMFRPDEAQARVILAGERHTLVTARAGSGKTATMVARVAHLVRVRGADPGAILMLAFNASAAQQLRERVARWVPGSRQPHVRTFDAFARAILPDGGAMRLLAEGEAAREVADVVARFLADPRQAGRVRTALGLHAAAVGGADGVAHTLRGERVASASERVLADTLLRLGLVGGEWSRLDYRVRYGMTLDGTWMRPSAALVDASGAARLAIDLGAAPGAGSPKDSGSPNVLRLRASDTTQPDFIDRLARRLERAGVPTRRLDRDDIWRVLERRVTDSFRAAAEQVLSRARQLRWSGADLRAAWARHDGEPRREPLITLCADVLDAYAARLDERGAEDFAGRTWRAVDALVSDAPVSGIDVGALRHIVIDEYQDFSARFAALVDGVRRRAPDARVLAVGDDWQAINGFAGSSLEYFRGFAAHFADDGAPAAMTLATNRRSLPAIVRLGNAVMQGRGAPAVALRSGAARIREFVLPHLRIDEHEREALGDDRLAVATVRLIRDHVERGRSVAVLARTNRAIADETVARVRAALGDAAERVEFSTVHRFKGREIDAVVLLQVDDWAYPLIHATWELTRAFGDTLGTLTDADRRLFYVGVTRARTHLDVVTSTDPSTFWTGSRGSVALAPGVWDLLPRAAGDDAERGVEIRVSNGTARDFDASREALREAGFRWNPEHEQWVAVVGESEVRSAAVLERPWAADTGIGISAHFLDGSTSWLRRPAEAGRGRPTRRLSR